MAFLTKDVSEWSNSSSYDEARAHFSALNVINDIAERGVKLSSDFLAAAKSEGHYQYVLQVVEKDRKRKPNLRKR